MPSPDGQGGPEEGKEYLVVGKEQKPGAALVLSQPRPTALLPPPYQLQEVMVPIVGNRVCNQRYQNSSNNTGQIIKDDMLCAGSEGQDSRQVRPHLSPTVLCPLLARWNWDSEAPCRGPCGDVHCFLPLPTGSWKCTWVQVGIVSWGYICGHRDFPGVYARVMSYISWIRKYVPPPPGS